MRKLLCLITPFFLVQPLLINIQPTILKSSYNIENIEQNYLYTKDQFATEESIKEFVNRQNFQLEPAKLAVKLLASQNTEQSWVVRGANNSHYQGQIVITNYLVNAESKPENIGKMFPNRMFLFSSKDQVTEKTLFEKFLVENKIKYADHLRIYGLKKTDENNGSATIEAIENSPFYSGILAIHFTREDIHKKIELQQVITKQNIRHINNIDYQNPENIAQYLNTEYGLTKQDYQIHNIERENKPAERLTTYKINLEGQGLYTGNVQLIINNYQKLVPNFLVDQTNFEINLGEPLKFQLKNQNLDWNKVKFGSSDLYTGQVTSINGYGQVQIDGFKSGEIDIYFTSPEVQNDLKITVQILDVVKDKVNIGKDIHYSVPLTVYVNNLDYLSDADIQQAILALDSLLLDQNIWVVNAGLSDKLVYGVDWVYRNLDRLKEVRDGHQKYGLSIASLFTSRYITGIFYVTIEFQQN